MQTERPPLRNPYDAFTGSDLDTFVTNIREKVGNALRPSLPRPVHGISPKQSPTDRYISHLAQSVRSEAAYSEPDSPPPSTLDKGKGRALDEGPGLHAALNGTYSDVDDSEGSIGKFPVASR